MVGSGDIAQLMRQPEAPAEGVAVDQLVVNKGDIVRIISLQGNGRWCLCMDTNNNEGRVLLDDIESVIKSAEFEKELSFRRNSAMSTATSSAGDASHRPDVNHHPDTERPENIYGDGDSEEEVMSIRSNKSPSVRFVNEAEREENIYGDGASEEEEPKKSSPRTIPKKQALEAKTSIRSSHQQVTPDNQLEQVFGNESIRSSTSTIRSDQSEVPRMARVVRPVAASDSVGRQSDYQDTDSMLRVHEMGNKDSASRSSRESNSSFKGIKSNSSKPKLSQQDSDWLGKRETEIAFMQELQMTLKRKGMRRSNTASNRPESTEGYNQATTPSVSQRVSKRVSSASSKRSSSGADSAQGKLTAPRPKSRNFSGSSGGVPELRTETVTQKDDVNEEEDDNNYADPGSGEEKLCAIVDSSSEEDGEIQLKPVAKQGVLSRSWVSQSTGRSKGLSAGSPAPVSSEKKNNMKSDSDSSDDAKSHVSWFSRQSALSCDVPDMFSLDGSTGPEHVVMAEDLSESQQPGHEAVVSDVASRSSTARSSMNVQAIFSDEDDVLQELDSVLNSKRNSFLIPSAKEGPADSSPSLGDTEHVVKPVSPKILVQDLNSFPWFFGKMVREEAEALLMPSKVPSETFLIRESERTKGYVISIKSHKTGPKLKVRHRKISHRRGKFCAWSPQKFASIPELVEAHMTAAGLNKLKIPATQEIRSVKRASVTSIEPSSEGDTSSDSDSCPVLQLTHFKNILSDRSNENSAIPWRTPDQWVVSQREVQRMELIMEGRCSSVFKARFVANKTVIVMKVFNPKIMNLKEFETDTSVLRDLHHPSLARMIGVHSDPKRSFLLMAYYPNGSVVDYCNSGRPLSTVQKQDICTKVASGMDFLSQQDFVHRDLRGRNVLLASDLSPRVTDYGLARLVKADAKHLLEPLMRWKWSAPEVLGPRVQWSSKSDVWSYGIFCWELYNDCAKDPYPEIRSRESLTKELERGTKPGRPRDCSGFVYDIITQCLEINPEKRISFRDIEVINKVMMKYK